MKNLLFEITPVSKKNQKGRQTKTASKKSAIDHNDNDLKRTHHYHPQYSDTVKHSKKYIQNLSKKSFDKLGKNIDIIREQMHTSFKGKKYAAYELLQEWEYQNIQARLIKLGSEKESKKK